MFGSVGGTEFLLIAVLALLLFGPRKLPEIGRSIGRALAEFRGATHEFRSSLERDIEVEKVREARDELATVGREVRDAARGPALPRGAPPAPELAATEQDPERNGAAGDETGRRS